MSDFEQWEIELELRTPADIAFKCWADYKGLYAVEYVDGVAVKPEEE